MKAPRILIIEDDPGIGPAMLDMLANEGYVAELSTRGDDGARRAEESDFDLVITDLMLPGVNGLDLIKRLHTARPKLPVIMLTAYGSTTTAIEATKHGACDYIVKPCEPEELLALVESAVSNSRMMSETIDLGDESTPTGPAIIGQSRVMQSLYKEIGRLSNVEVPVLIRGATGTGKELVARAIYRHGARAAMPFIAVNCAALPSALIESELFGHERGAFTGADRRRIGRFEQAAGGTLFLDEIGDLPLDTQAKLLRALQDSSFQRLGGEEPIAVDVRILAATHRDLEAAIHDGGFREDLFFRLNVVSVRVPSLSERTEDIPAIVRYFIRRYSTEFGDETPSVHPDAIRVFQSGAWPGNVRQLENAVRQALVASRPFPLNADHARNALHRVGLKRTSVEMTVSEYIVSLLERARGGEIRNAHGYMIDELEAELFAESIRITQGNQSKAARLLGVTRLKMREKLRELSLLEDKVANVSNGDTSRAQM